MLSIKNALRRPIVSALGILLVVSMTAFLSVGIGQAYVANNTLNSIEDNFTTVALMTEKFRNQSNVTLQFGDQTQTQVTRQFPEKVTDFLAEMPEKYPDIVKDVSSPGLASAYIPELTVDFFTHHSYEESVAKLNYTGAWPRPHGTPYCCAVFEIELTEIGEPFAEESFIEITEDQTKAVFETEYRAQLKGNITSVIALHEGFDEPTGRVLSVNLHVKNLEELESLNLTVGEKYIVYSYYYVDRVWKYGNDYVGCLVGDELVYDENVYYMSTDGTKTPASITEKTYIGENSETVTCTVEEYVERYSLPSMVHVPNGAEAFLASDEGAKWREAIENIEINEHAFPVIGVEKLGYITDFAREDSRIVEGRDFTSKELEDGANVCIISETLAAMNGISVGDTIDMNYYIYDWSVPYQWYINEGIGIVEPSAYYYTSTTGMAETESYKVVGLYRDSSEWSYTTGDIYSFTPNTIFVPKSSVTGSMDYSDQGMFRTYVLKNGSIDELQKEVALAGFDGLFTYYDQGYEIIAENLFAYDEVAKQALAVGVSSSLVIAAIYFILFPMQQKKNVSIMYSLGATRRRRMSYILGSNLCILLPGTLLGCLLSIFSWQYVSQALYAAAEAESAITFEVDTPLVLMIAAIQFVCMLTASLILALLMAKDRKMHERK
ncbi:MAG: ABC transporter permease [Clostridia bacterium]|nr:ABC transporter permease [Clostridia bacterium]